MLKNFDYFRKVPREFTEGSAMGSILSIVAAVVMGTLFVLEFRDFRRTKQVTDLVMDPGGVDGNDLYIAFKVYMPELVCQFASVEVADSMGTKRQGIHKDMDMNRMDAQGKVIAPFIFDEAKKIEYEELVEETEGPAEAPCKVTLYEHADFTGWEADFGPGEYDHARLSEMGAQNDDCESVVVGKGCYAVVAEHGEHEGWEIVLDSTGGAKKDGRYDGKDLEAIGTARQHSVLNDLSSLVVHAGSGDEAKVKATKAKEARKAGLPQRGQIDVLDETSFDQFLTDRPEKMVVIDFYAPWCHWCQLLDPVWKQTAERLPDQAFAKDVRMAKVDCEANRQLCMEHMIRAYPTIQTYTHGENTPAETYYGDRTTEAFFQWMGHEHKIMAAELSTEKAQAGRAAAAAGRAPAGDGGENKGPAHALRLKQKGAKGPEGCEVEGRLKVKRIPGNFHINFVHDNMDFHNSLINASHRIEYLIFSEAPMPKPLSEHVLRMHNFISDAESRAYKVSGTNELRESMYTSLHEDRTFEHFVQIVPTYNSQQKTTAYRYTVTSAEHEDTDRFPSAKFSFQMSPMMVVISSKTTPLYHFLTNICALIGGLFTVFSMANGVLDTIIKKLQGGPGL